METYKIPSMCEINEITPNGYTVISLFSGAGGSSLGYKMAGFTVKCALEFTKEARKTYETNFPTTPVLQKDIRETTGKELLELAGVTEIDILDGSPPCSAFSIAGAREKHWGQVVPYSNTKQRTDDLFNEYIRMVKEIRPKVCIAENVKGIIIGKAKDYYLSVVEAIRELGYTVEYKLLNAKDYGVPQERERVILIGIRNDIVTEYDTVFPKKHDRIITQREAIEDLMDKGTDQKEVSWRMELLPLTPPMCSRQETKRILAQYGKKPYCTHCYRDRWNDVSRTIVQHHTRPYHQVVNRIMSIWEAKRLQSFPDDFVLEHSPSKNWEQVGRAVPPLLMKAIAETVKTEILDKQGDRNA